MTIPAPVADWCREHGWGSITGADEVGGGCIHRCLRLRTESGPTLFLKLNPSVPADMFQREAEGLAALAVSGGPRLPRAHLWGPTFLLLEDLRPSGRARGFWSDLGRQLAALHDVTAPRFGFDHDNYIGLTPQPNPWTDDGHEFFAAHRLLHQARLALDAGRLERSDVARIESLCRRLPSLVPSQPASLIHGDLWSGNVVGGPDGEPCLIDPACHHGWAEAELGMTDLFGGFPSEFYEAYESSRRLAPGWRERLPVYNLYHLLNHLNLFGSGYLGPVRGVLRRYG